MKEFLLSLICIMIALSLMACTKTTKSLKLQTKSITTDAASKSQPNDSEIEQQVSSKLSVQDVSIRIGADGSQQKIVRPGDSLLLPRGNGIIPIFVQVKGQNLISLKLPLDVTIQPSSWHFESKNSSDGDTYYFILRVDESAPSTGEVSIAKIRGKNGELLLNQPIKFTLKLANNQ